MDSVESDTAHVPHDLRVITLTIYKIFLCITYGFYWQNNGIWLKYGVRLNVLESEWVTLVDI